MEHSLHALAPHNLPFFITAPGDTDTLLVVMGVSLVAMILFLGSVYFRLHSLPEQLAHRNPNKMQFEIVAVLGLLALFTHNTNFWFAALILAMIRFPDFGTPLREIAASLAKGFPGKKAEPDPDPQPIEPLPVSPHTEAED